MQVIVIAFRLREAHDPEYAPLRTSDDAKWQPIAGGAEDFEMPSEAARREAFEEAGLPTSVPLYALQSLDSVPVIHFQVRDLWPADLYVVPQFSFGADATDVEIEISDEHTRIEWLDYDSATALLAYQSNATALWELHQRLKRRDLPTPVR
jgi:dATP pyrophosphohydrolase